MRRVEERTLIHNWLHMAQGRKGNLSSTSSEMARRGGSRMSSSGCCRSGRRIRSSTSRWRRLAVITSRVAARQVLVAIKGTRRWKGISWHKLRPTSQWVSTRGKHRRASGMLVETRASRSTEASTSATRKFTRASTWKNSRRGHWNWATLMSAPRSTRIPRSSRISRMLRLLAKRVSRCRR